MTEPTSDRTANPPEVSIRERGKAERRDRVVEAAREILTTEGVEGLSMRALSVQSGVSLPTIYSLIGGRDDVLAEVLDRLGTVFEAETAASSGEGLELCFEIADRFLDTITTHATLTRSVISEGLTPMLADADSGLLRRYALALVSALADASATGDLDDDAEPVFIVEQMVSLTAVRVFRWATADPASGAADEQMRAAVTHGIGLLLAGSTDPAAAGPVRARIRKAQAVLLGGTK
jgi:AcrR family transcriptional regulator